MLPMWWECSAHGELIKPMHSRHSSSAKAGFVLPLSITGALVLLLSSLSIQSLVLHSRQVQAAERSRLLAEDHLASAAQQLASRLLGPFACLQPVASADWLRQPWPPACPPELDIQQLHNIPVEGEVVQLLSWSPLAEGGGVMSLRLGDQGLQRRYGLSAAGLQEQR